MTRILGIPEDGEDLGEIPEDDELGDEDGEPGVLGGEHDSDVVQG